MSSLDLSTGMVMVLGMLHALEPGHGKTALATYMISGKRTWVDGIVVSISSVLSHTFVVFLMALSIHYATNNTYSHDFIDSNTNILRFTSGVCITAIGFYLMLKSLYGHNSHSCCSCSHPPKGKSPIPKSIKHSLQAC